MARVQLARADRTAQVAQQITAEQCEAGLPTGIYPIFGAEATKLGLPSVSGMVVSMRQAENFQIQIYRSWDRTPGYQRFRSLRGWQPWFTI